MRATGCARCWSVSPAIGASSAATARPASEEDDERPAGELLRRVVEDIGGLRGKQHVAVDVISPLLLAKHADSGVTDLLAGELMGDFGGFLDRDLRRSDFALGYESTLAWCNDGLGACGLPDGAVQAAAAAIERRRPERWQDVRRGQAGQRDLPWRARLRMARILLRAGRALLR